MISWPWDSLIEGFDDETGFPKYDRRYTAEELREVLKTFFSNGVFTEQANAFAVTAGDGMQAIVSPGRCFIQGDVGVEDSARTMAFAAATSQPRYDTIVLRWDNNIDARSIDLYVKQGVASDKPVRPTLTRGETVWELGLCDIYIPSGTTSISQDRITDTRLDNARCGSVHPFQTIDTSTFFRQIQAAVDRAVELAEAAIDGTLYGQLENQLEEKVDKAGDEMSGDLTISKSDPSLSLNVPEYDASFRLHTYAQSKGNGRFAIFNANAGSNSLIIDEETDALRLAKPLPVASGGTGAKSAKEAASNLGLFTFVTDANVTGGSGNDTRAFWVDMPIGAYSFNQNDMLKGQPNQYCTLLHFKKNSSVIQQMLLCNSSTQGVWMRTLNGSQDTNDEQFANGGWCRLATVTSIAATRFDYGLSNKGIEMPQVQAGTVTMNFKDSGSSSVTVKFPSAFKGKPIVTMTLQQGVPLNHLPIFFVDNVSASGFTAHSYNSAASGNSASFSVGWVAVY